VLVLLLHLPRYGGVFKISSHPVGWQITEAGVSFSGILTLHAASFKLWQHYKAKARPAEGCLSKWFVTVTDEKTSPTGMFSIRLIV
jgi:hypothetical protein